MIMRVPVEIFVTNKRLNYRDLSMVSDAPEAKESTNSFSGFMDVKGDNCLLDYEEVFDDGEVASTTVMVKNGSALISRRGDINTNLVFMQGESCDCVCHNGYRNLNLRVNTKKIKSDLCRLGGKLSIDYTIEIMGNLAEKNSFCVSVCPSDSVS